MILEGLFEKLADNLLDLLPFYRVMSYEMACQWTFGKNPVAKGPGWHWRWYGITTYEKVPVVDEVLELPIQSVLTKDKKSVSFKAVVGYRVNDIVAHYCNVNDFADSTKSRAMGHLAKRVRAQTLDEVEFDLGKLEASCKGTLGTKLKEWGTEVLFVEFIDFVEVRTQIRLFGSERITKDV